MHCRMKLRWCVNSALCSIYLELTSARINFAKIHETRVNCGSMRSGIFDTHYELCMNKWKTSKGSYLLLKGRYRNFKRLLMHGKLIDTYSVESASSPRNTGAYWDVAICIALHL